MKLENLNEFWLYPVAYCKGEIDPRWYQGQFTVDYYSLVFIQKGKLTITQNSSSLTAGPGEGILIKACQSYTQTYQPKTKLISLKFFAMWKNERPAFHGDFPCHFSSQESRLMISILNPIFAYFPKEFNFSTGWSLDQPLAIKPYFKIISLTYEFLAQMSDLLEKRGFLIGIQETQNHRIEKVIREMRLNFYTKKPQDEHYSRIAGMEKHAFCKIFVKEIGMSPIQYYNLLRLGYAKKELVLDINSIKKIQYTLGFPSASSFTLWFQRHVGLSPSHYIDLYRGKKEAPEGARAIRG